MYNRVCNKHYPIIKSFPYNDCPSLTPSNFPKAVVRLESSTKLLKLTEN